MISLCNIVYRSRPQAGQVVLSFTKFLTMKLQVHSIHFDADRKLIDFIQKKLDKLDRFYDRVIDGEVFLRLNNEGTDNKTVVVKLNVPGDQIMVTEKARTFEAATDLAVDTLSTKLKRFKAKLQRV